MTGGLNLSLQDPLNPLKVTVLRKINRWMDEWIDKGTN